MSTQPNPEHVDAGAALLRMDKARKELHATRYLHGSGMATTADYEQARENYASAVAAYYEVRGEQR